MAKQREFVKGIQELDQAFTVFATMWLIFLNFFPPKSLPSFSYFMFLIFSCLFPSLQEKGIISKMRQGTMFLKNKSEKIKSTCSNQRNLNISLFPLNFPKPTLLHNGPSTTQ